VTAALVLAGLLLVLVGLELARGWRRLGLARGRRRGGRAEARARALLERHGYALVAVQETAVGFIRVDGETRTYDLRADAIVVKDGERLVAEVKTGAAALLENRATRRQLLEYAYAFGLDGVLLVDMAAGRIHRVEFPGLARGRGARNVA
jgi:hypothetical protein